MEPNVGEMLVLDEAVAVADRDNVAAELLQALLDANVDGNRRPLVAAIQNAETHLRE